MTVTVKTRVVVGAGASITTSLRNETAIAWHERHYRGSYFTVISDAEEGESTRVTF